MKSTKSLHRNGALCRAALRFHCCRIFVVCPMTWDKESTWKSIPALSLLGPERCSDPAVKDSHFIQVKDMERTSCICLPALGSDPMCSQRKQVRSEVGCCDEPSGEPVSSTEIRTSLRNLWLDSTQCSHGEQISTYLELRLVLCLSNFSDLVYFIISDPVSLSLISKAGAGLHRSLNGPLLLIKILV